jgi:CheY-like chemotaxis protein
VIHLDLKMPGIGGIEACREIRSCSAAPIVMVSAKKSRKDRTEAFEAGADQYISKPFGIEELVARIHTVDRRINASRSAVLALGDIEVDFETHEVKRKDGVVHLTAKSSSFCIVWLSTRVRSSRTGAFCKLFGGPTMVMRSSISGYLSTSSVRRSNPILESRHSFSPIRPAGIGCLCHPTVGAQIRLVKWFRERRTSGL